MHLTKWLFLATFGLCCLAGLSLVRFTFLYLSSSPFELQQTDAPPSPDIENKALPTPFAPPNGYTGIGEPVLHLTLGEPNIAVPDFRNLLSYYGTNERPDSTHQSPPLQFGLSNGQNQFTVISGQPLYLSYNKQNNSYEPSPENTPTNLWFVAKRQENTATIEMRVKTLSGKIIDTPANLSSFQLPEKDYIKSTSEKWEIGKLRADPTLLARQRARWYGQDKFINAFGGSEYPEEENHEWIEWSGKDKDKNDLYGIYLAAGECAIWRNDRWERAKLGPETQPFALLCLKTVEERSLKFDLWNLEGKGKIQINLLRSTLPWNPEALVREFKYIATRTLSQYIFELKGKRMTLVPGDWFLLTENGWEKLSTVREVDDFVNRTLNGVLFTFDDVAKKDDRPVMKGRLFSEPRSDIFEFEIPLELESEEPSHGKPPPVNKFSEMQSPLHSSVLDKNQIHPKFPVGMHSYRPAPVVNHE